MGNLESIGKTRDDEYAPQDLARNLADIESGTARIPQRRGQLLAVQLQLLQHAMAEIGERTHGGRNCFREGLAEGKEK